MRRWLVTIAMWLGFVATAAAQPCSWNFALGGGDGVQLWDGGIFIGSGTGTVSVGVGGRELRVRFLFGNGQDNSVGEAYFWTCPEPGQPNDYAHARRKFKITANGPEWNEIQPFPWSREFNRPVGLSCPGCCADSFCDYDCDGIDNDDDTDDDGDGVEDCDEEDQDDDGDEIPDDEDENPGNGDEVWGWDKPPTGEEWGGGPNEPLCCPAGTDGADCNAPCPPEDPDDFDGDGIPNNEDPDDDNDGIGDCQDDDDDNDGTPDDQDDDDDNDGTPDDTDEQPGGCDCDNDFDCDGIENNDDEDDDGDGIPDDVDDDDDNDGIPDDQDPDDDNDGIPDDEDDQPGGCPPDDRNCNGIPDENEEGDCDPPPANDHDCDEVPNNCDPDYSPCVDANLNGKCDSCDEDCPNPPCCPQKPVDHDCDNVPNLCDRDYVGPGPACPDVNDNRICDGCECDPSDPGYPNCDEPCADPPANDHDCDGVHNECDKDYDPQGCIDANNNRICDHCEEDTPPIGPAPELTLPKAPKVEWEVPSLDLSTGGYDFDINLPWVDGGSRQLHVSTDPTAWNDSRLVSELPLSPVVFTVVDNVRKLVRLMLQIMLLWSMGPRFIRIFHTT